MERFVVNEDQTLINVHRREDCIPPCVIHHPTDHHMKDWKLRWRWDREIFERICPEHGVGHPDPDSHNRDRTHGCCGCCSKE